jgi:D-serine deaminase-like pyridoxal phosphate-dependent protein
VIARLQRDAGARGITCQKVGEAEVMADAGLDDILISYNILGEEKLGRLAALMRKARMVVAADNPTTVAGLPRAAEISGRTLEVVVECDTGRKRAGVESAAEAIALAKDIASRPGLAFAGFLLYPPETAIEATQASSTRRSRACARRGSRRVSSRRAARRTSRTSAASRARPSTGPAPTSSTTA